MTNLHANKGRPVQSHISLKSTIVNRPGSNRCGPPHTARSWFGFAFITLLFLSPNLVHGQVPGICTQSDGFSWPMNSEPNAAVLNAARLPIGMQRNAQNQNPIDTATLKAFLNRTDLNSANAKKKCCQSLLSPFGPQHQSTAAYHSALESRPHLFHGQQSNCDDGRRRIARSG